MGIGFGIGVAIALLASALVVAAVATGWLDAAVRTVIAGDRVLSGTGSVESVPIALSGNVAFEWIANAQGAPCSLDASVRSAGGALPA